MNFLDAKALQAEIASSDSRIAATKSRRRRERERDRERIYWLMRGTVHNGKTVIIKLG